LGFHGRSISDAAAMPLRKRRDFSESVSKKVSSGISVGFSSSEEGRLEVEFAAEEEDADSVVVEISGSPLFGVGETPHTQQWGGCRRRETDN
jgi:hypothetical protein